MRSAAVIVILALLAAGCGSGRRVRPVTTTSPPQTGLRIGVVGPLDVRVQGAVIEHGSLAQVAGDSLVIVLAADPAAAGVGAVAAAYPASHFALLGGSARGLHLRNVAGLVIRNDQAAQLGGVVAGLVAADEGVSKPRVAWVGPIDLGLAKAFARGVHELDASAQVLRVESPDERTACKEAALSAIARGAVAVFAARGACADAAAVGAHQQNVVALRLSDFELPQIPAAQVIRDAVNGVYHGREDIVFGLSSGAVGIAHLDRRISTTAAVHARVAAQQMAGGLHPSG